MQNKTTHTYKLLSTIIFLLCSIIGTASVEENRVALIIGNAQYTSIGALVNATNDAKDMTKALTELGFKVISGTDLTKKQMRSKIREFDTALKFKPAENTIGLFYYAGHGLEVDGDNYLVPIDADMEYQEDARDEGIPLNLVTSRMKSAKNRMNVVILDACRNNPFPKRDRAISSGGWGALGNLANGMFIAYGTSPGRKAADTDGRGRNGLFTKHILANIKLPGQTLEQVFKATRAGVLDDSNGRQVTWQNNATTGDFYFNGIANNQTINTVASISPQQKLPLLSDIVKRSSAPTLDVKSTKSYNPGETFKSCDQCPDMIAIPSGVFTMGRDDGHPLEGPSRLVSVKQFNLAISEITFTQWDACYAAKGCTKYPTDEGWGRSDRPVINISWNDAQQYITWLNKQFDTTYRLPSEAEWEYASRAGSAKNFSWGDKLGTNMANCKVCGSQWDDKQSAPVKSFDPNKFGIYDMHGNVIELVQDCFNPHYYEAPNNQSPRMTGNCDSHMFRGGYWGSDSYFMWSLFRNGTKADSFSNGMGFRVASD